MRHKNEIVRKFSDFAEMLFDFRHVLMRERFVSVKRIHSLRVMRIRRRFRARTGRTCFRINNDLSRQQTAFDHRRERQKSCGRKTARIGNVIRLFDLFTVRFSQAVNELFL